jgi:hypothetical protein
VDGFISTMSFMRKIRRILRKGHATFDTMDLEDDEGKVLCDAVAAGQLALAFKMGRPRLDFPPNVVWMTEEVF